MDDYIHGWQDAIELHKDLVDIISQVRKECTSKSDKDSFDLGVIYACNEILQRALNVEKAKGATQINE